MWLWPTSTAPLLVLRCGLCPFKRSGDSACRTLSPIPIGRYRLQRSAAQRVCAWHCGMVSLCGDASMDLYVFYTRFYCRKCVQWQCRASRVVLYTRSSLSLYLVRCTSLSAHGTGVRVQTTYVCSSRPPALTLSQAHSRRSPAAPTSAVTQSLDQTQTTAHLSAVVVSHTYQLHLHDSNVSK